MEKIDITGILRRLPLFQQLSDPEVSQLAPAVRERRLAKGEMLFQKGDPAKGFFIVVFGQIKLAFPSSQGNEKVVEIIGHGQSFGEAVMFMGKPYPVFAEALVDSMVMHVPHLAITELLAKDTEFANRMLAGLSLRLHSLVADVETYSLRSSTQRLIGYLLQHCAEAPAGEAVSVELPTSKQVLASRLNLTPETFSRILHTLAERKLIEVKGRQITIADLERLRVFDL